MGYKIRFLPERRLSLKILGHKIRKYFPKYGYPALLHIRFALFQKRCMGNLVPMISYSDGSWVNRETTEDLQNMTTHLESVKGRPSILQIGIGNSSLFSAIREKTTRFVGITIVEDEVAHARRSFPNEFGNTYQVRLMNKYSDEVAELEGGFDFIIDNDLSSYACCKHHFGTMLDIYRNILADDGCVLVGVTGLGYFDTGFGLTPKMIAPIAKEHGLHFQEERKFHILRLRES